MSLSCEILNYLSASLFSPWIFFREGKFSRPPAHPLALPGDARRMNSQGYLSRGPGVRTGRAKSIGGQKPGWGNPPLFPPKEGRSMKRPSFYFQGRPDGQAEVGVIPAPVTAL